MSDLPKCAAHFDAAAKPRLSRLFGGIHFPADGFADQKMFSTSTEV
jgi:hypothetical protein